MIRSSLLILIVIFNTVNSGKIQAMFRIKKDGRKNDGKNDRTSKLIQ